jgi:hypothetical protein
MIKLKIFTAAGKAAYIATPLIRNLYYASNPRLARRFAAVVI